MCNDSLTLDLGSLSKYLALGIYKKQIQEEEKSIASLNRRIRELEIQVDHQRKYMGGYVFHCTIICANVHASEDRS